MFRKRFARICVVLLVLTTAPLFASDDVMPRESAGRGGDRSFIVEFIKKIVRSVTRGTTGNSDGLTVPKP